MSGADLVDSVTTRLRAEVTDLRSVEGAAELSELLGKKIMPARLPAAFVLPLGDDAGGDAYATGLMSQQVTETVAVLVIDKVSGDARGGKSWSRGIVPLKHSVFDALHNWKPGESNDPLQYRRGRLVAVNAAGVFYQLDFQSAWYLRTETRQEA
ncbi:phage tail terminator protein [Oceanibaculum indicum]|uniref:Uncharacterized protein n=1 Tax=Oceanibaculum indicum P24 TaxID=1207063 RepID=K2J5S6_9PROT|nr:hypothetical protein [Oceanibaculum indicum]EKE78431.1 hypothetical protein P24_02686 [Oceanibaculum indicum P24]